MLKRILSLRRDSIRKMGFGVNRQRVFDVMIDLIVIDGLVGYFGA